MSQPTTEDLLNEAVARSIIAGDVADLLEQLPPALRIVFWKEVKRSSTKEPSRGLVALVVIAAHVVTAAREGWLDELVGRVERELS